MTGLMYNRRVSKTHPRMEALGALDELSAAIGVARAAAQDRPRAGELRQIQKQLVALMGEIATHPDDLARYKADGYDQLPADASITVESWIKELEAQNISFKGWATPGATAPAAALDLARSIARRAERNVIHLVELGEIQNPSLQVFLNRVSDFLWLSARAAESEI